MDQPVKTEQTLFAPSVTPGHPYVGITVPLTRENVALVLSDVNAGKKTPVLMQRNATSAALCFAPLRVGKIRRSTKRLLREVKQRMLRSVLARCL
jgi:hypothetical protein